MPLARYANAALGACQAVLEAEATTADLLPPTLNAICQVLCGELAHVSDACAVLLPTLTARCAFTAYKTDRGRVSGVCWLTALHRKLQQHGAP